MRDLTQEEKDCIDQLVEVKTKTFSDFTDSFRLLSTISAGNVKDDLEPVIESYLNICAPIEIIKKI